MVEDKDMHPRDDDRNEEEDESPVPDPEAKENPPRTIPRRTD
jgi:hypothetical protein